MSKALRKFAWESASSKSGGLSSSAATSREKASGSHSLSASEIARSILSKYSVSHSESRKQLQSVLASLTTASSSQLQGFCTTTTMQSGSSFQKSALTAEPSTDSVQSLITKYTSPFPKPEYKANPKEYRNVSTGTSKHLETLADKEKLSESSSSDGTLQGL